MILTNISVIIPVFNAEKYIRRAVESAVDLSEVSEVILVEDKSPDNALVICQDLEKEYDKVKLYRHPNGENRGAGASRNSGLDKARGEFIAFLDADDWYLPNRFKATKLILEDASIDGVYEPIGSFFYEDEGTLFGRKMTKKEGDKKITFPKIRVEANHLFEYLLTSRYGNFSTIGVTLRKDLVERVGAFSEILKLHQDTEYWIRCAYYGKLVAPEDPIPVAVRGVHKENRIAETNRRSKSLFVMEVFNKFKNKRISLKAKKSIFLNAVSFDSSRKHRKSNPVQKYSELLLISLKYLSIFNPFTFLKNK